ncbi:MAG TPA: YihY/virulence factor BrkB family protein [Saprospiraceae bacterium]|nr:YihY/virulence factor BrkB family protein [Saprospiraceae bacterium]
MNKFISGWINKLLNSSFFIGLKTWSQNVTIPGFQRVSLYTTFTFLYLELKRNDLNLRASAISYSFFLALFPALIFFFTLTAYLPESLHFFTTMEDSLKKLVPDKAEEFFWDNIIVGLLPQAKGSILSIGFVMSIYFASNGLLALMQGFDKTYNSSFRKRSWWEKELVAYFLTFLLALLFIISMIVIILSGQIFNWIGSYFELTHFFLVVVQLSKYVLLLILFYIIIAVIYRFGPALHKPFVGISPGAVFATAGSLITSTLFGYFVDNFGNYHKIYGAISALIIALIWIRINVMILILGFELNAAIAVNRDIGQIVKKRSELDSISEEDI